MENILGTAVKQVRKQKGITQGDLSKLTGFGQPTISNHENGNRALDEMDILIYSKALNVSPQELFDIAHGKKFVTNNIVEWNNSGINGLSTSGNSTNTYNFRQSPDNQGAHNDTMRDLGIADVKLSRSILNRLDRQIEYQREQMELQRSIDRRLETIVDLQEEILDEIRLVTRKKD